MWKLAVETQVCTSDSEEGEVDMASNSKEIGLLIWVFLEQTLPHGEIMLIEVERKGLGITFAFFCSHKKFDDQTSF